MPWPFAANPPDFDADFHDVPTPLTLVPGVVSSGIALWLIGASFANDSGGPLRVRVEDGSGQVLVPDLLIPDGAAVPFEWAFLPVTGLKESASGPGITAKYWGYLA
jgi:hypothetical protein